METVKFLDRNGEIVEGHLLRRYEAFEGSTRYIIAVDDREYRCIKTVGGYEELVI